MRTRSQPDSPGGFVSLEDNKRATRRTTRSTRSASRPASQEPTSEKPAEPATQPATRSKTQASTTKRTTSKKATSTTSAAKPQTRKSSRRGTRRTTRKAEHDAAEEPQETIGKITHDTARTDNKGNIDVNPEDRESGPSASNSALMEPKNSEREYTISPLSLQNFVTLQTPSPLPCHLALFISSFPLQGVTGVQAFPRPTKYPVAAGCPRATGVRGMEVDFDCRIENILNLQSEPIPGHFESLQQPAESAFLRSWMYSHSTICVIAFPVSALKMVILSGETRLSTRH
ncbi:hypothetical protein BDW75DRAFT_162 [Aspergillus navahoensis]